MIFSLVDEVVMRHTAETWLQSSSWPSWFIFFILLTPFSPLGLCELCFHLGLVDPLMNQS